MKTIYNANTIKNLVDRLEIYQNADHSLLYLQNIAINEGFTVQNKYLKKPVADFEEFTKHLRKKFRIKCEAAKIKRGGQNQFKIYTLSYF